MKSFLGLIAWCLVVYGPRACIDPYTAFGRWCLSGSGDWIYRAERTAYEAGCKAYQGREPRQHCPFAHPVQADMWRNGWDDEASEHSFKAF